MVDFRYHLVSLISVFLALAVGIVLGAGPLQGALGSQLAEQVETLRNERNEYRAEVDQLSHDSQLQHDFIAAAGPLLAANTLNHRNIAIVLFGDVDDAAERQVVQQVRLAGGTVVETVSLSSAWFDPQEAESRAQVAEGLRSQMENLPTGLPADADTIDTIATALAVSLTQRTADGRRGPDTHVLDLRLGQSGLVAFDGRQDQPADAILVLTGPVAEEGQTDATVVGPDGHLPELPAALARVAPVVVAGPTAMPGDLVDAVLAERRVADRVSTVSGIETEMGQIQVALVLAARIAGNVGHYGFGPGVQVLPPIIPALLAPIPEPELVVGDDAAGGEEASGEDADGAVDGEEADAEAPEPATAGAQS